MSAESLQEIENGRRLRQQQAAKGIPLNAVNHLSACDPITRTATTTTTTPAGAAGSIEKHGKPTHISSLPSSLAAHFSDLAEGLKNLSTIPTLVIGVQSDALFPFVQQRELAEALRVNGNKQVVYYELDSPMGHDSFLLDVANVTAALKGFL